MVLSESSTKILNIIEKKRHSKNPLFIFLVLLKDILWVLGYWLPNRLILIYKIIRRKASLLTYGLTKRYRKKVKRYSKISFCITCMDRLPHLKKTLRKNIRDNGDYPKIEFVLLDYNSSDGLQEWIFKNFKAELASGRLIYYQTKEPQHFHMAKAKNIAHRLASGDVVCNLDADNYTGKDFSFFINSTMQSSFDIIGIHKKDEKGDQDFVKGCGGRIFLSKNNFLKLGGYNEDFIGWGYEDDDFKMRADILGLKEVLIPHFFLFAIPHSHFLREKNMKVPMEASKKMNKNLLESMKDSKAACAENKPIDFTKIKKIELTEQYGQPNDGRK